MRGGGGGGGISSGSLLNSSDAESANETGGGISGNSGRIPASRALPAGSQSPPLDDSVWWLFFRMA